MHLPINFSSAYLILTVITLIVVITSEFINPRHSRVNIIIEKNRLRLVSRVLLVIFIASTAIRISFQFFTFLGS